MKNDGRNFALQYWVNAKVVGANQSRLEPNHRKGDPAYLMSRSELVDFALCPAKWLASDEEDDDEEEEQTTAMKFGSILDAIITDPEHWQDKVAIHPATYTNSKGLDSKWTYQANHCKDWRADALADGLIPISPKMADKVRAAICSVMNHPGAAALIACSQKQVLVTAEWKDKETGLQVPFASLLDLVPDVSDPVWGKCIADTKTARNGNPARWARECDDRGYDVQSAIYFDIYTAATGEDRTDFAHLVVENTAPYHVVDPIPAMSSEFLDWGRRKYTKALALYCQCVATGNWPSYAPAGMSFGGLQIIGPDDLWNYRQTAGSVESRMMPKEEAEKQTESDDLIP